MGFDMNNFMKNVDSTIGSVKGKYEKAYKVVEITAKGKSNELENQRSSDLTQEMNDLEF